MHCSFNRKDNTTIAILNQKNIDEKPNQPPTTKKNPNQNIKVV